MSAGERRRAAGFTFLEVTVVLAILSMMGLIVERVLLHTRDGERYVEAIRRATEKGQRVSHEVAEATSASRMVLGGDARGLGYLGALDLGGRPRMPTSRLPTILESGRLEPDPVGEPATGNILLFAAEVDPVGCVADASSGRLRYIDTYRLVCVYPTIAGRTLVPESGPAVDLVMWRSAAFPSRAQVLAVEDPDEQEAVLRDLYDRFGHDLAWDPALPVDEAFFAIDAFGSLGTSPEVGLWIQEDVDVSEGGRLLHGDVQLARSNAAVRLRRPVFATGSWMPNGFEVKVVGPSGSRKVWIHLVAESPASAGRSAVQANTLIVSVRDG